jgi:hypothetical protein
MGRTLVTPAARGQLYSFQFNDTCFVVDAACAGRITSFSLSGREMLLPGGTGNNFGSTFWPSPQSDWGWPPPAEIDSQPYQATLDGPVLSLTGTSVPGLDLAVSKRFTADATAETVTVQYGLLNTGPEARRVAPWEITRVPAGGLTFFPMGQGEPRKGAQDLLPLQISDGVAWFPYDGSKINSDQKVFADGSEGWIAHAQGDLLLVKSFADIGPAQAAPGEAEIELYANPERTYVEVENQGAYGEIAPGGSVSWTVRWFLRRLDNPAQVGPALADIVRALLR